MAELPRKIPVKPPEMNSETKPMPKRLALVNRILPPYRVAIQLNTFTAEGTAMIRVKITKKLEMKGFTPDMNMWCAHTMKDRKPMARIEYTIAR